MTQKELVENRINEAVARYHVVRFELPQRALIPQSEFNILASQYGEPSNVRAVHLLVKAGKDEGNLEVKPGKVPDVTLFRTRE